MQSVSVLIDNRKEQSSNQSIIDNRVRGLHQRLYDMFNDRTYEIGYTYKVAKKLSDYDILKVADYCVRKARKPSAAFISICEKKLA